MNKNIYKKFMWPCITIILITSTFLLFVKSYNQQEKYEKIIYSYKIEKDKNIATINDKEQIITELKTKIKSEEDRNNKLYVKIDELTKANSQNENIIYNTNKKIENMNKSNIEKNNKIIELEKLISQLQLKIDELNKKIQSQNEQINKLINTNQNEINNLNNKIKEYEINIKSNNTKIDILEKEKIEMQSNIDKLNKLLQDNNIQIEKENIENNN